MRGPALAIPLSTGSHTFCALSLTHAIRQKGGITKSSLFTRARKLHGSRTANVSCGVSREGACGDISGQTGHSLPGLVPRKMLPFGAPAERPSFHKGQFAYHTFGAKRQRQDAAIQQSLLYVFEELHPDFTMLGAVAPIAVDGGPRALAFAHQEKTATLAAAQFL